MRFLLGHDVPGEVAGVLRYEGYEVTELREVLAVRASDVEVFNYACEHGLMLTTCNRDDFLSLAAKPSNPGIIILVRRRSRHVECGHLLALLKRAGEFGLIHNVNFARVFLRRRLSGSNCHCIGLLLASYLVSVVTETGQKVLKST